MTPQRIHAEAEADLEALEVENDSAAAAIKLAAYSLKNVFYTLAFFRQPLSVE